MVPFGFGESWLCRFASRNGEQEARATLKFTTSKNNVGFNLDSSINVIMSKKDIFHTFVNNV